MTYAEARPWAVAIKEEVLERRMPPWGAVKGFADFRNDKALTPEQLELITSWVGGGVPEGEAKDLAARAQIRSSSAARFPPKAVMAVSGELQLPKDFSLDGLLPKNVPETRHSRSRPRSRTAALSRCSGSRITTPIRSSVPVPDSD